MRTLLFAMLMTAVTYGAESQTTPATQPESGATVLPELREIQGRLAMLYGTLLDLEFTATQKTYIHVDHTQGEPTPAGVVLTETPFITQEETHRWSLSDKGYRLERDITRNDRRGNAAVPRHQVFVENLEEKWVFEKDRKFLSKRASRSSIVDGRKILILNPDEGVIHSSPSNMILGARLSRIPFNSQERTTTVRGVGGDIHVVTAVTSGPSKKTVTYFFHNDGRYLPFQVEVRPDSPDHATMIIDIAWQDVALHDPSRPGNKRELSFPKKIEVLKYLRGHLGNRIVVDYDMDSLKVLQPEKCNSLFMVNPDDYPDYQVEAVPLH